MKFVLHSHDKIDLLQGLASDKKTKMAQVSREILLCMLMAIAATVTNSLTIGLLLWAKHASRNREKVYFENDTNVTLAPDKPVCDFRVRTKSIFRLHDTRMKFHPRTKFSLGLKTEINSFRSDLFGKEISSRYQVNNYIEMYEDGMNSFQNESLSGII